MPDDPLFAKIMKLYMKEWKATFGEARYFLVDSFNEMELPEEEYRVTAEKKRTELNDLVKGFHELNFKERSEKAAERKEGAGGDAAAGKGGGEKSSSQRKFERPSERRRRLEQERRDGGGGGGRYNDYDEGGGNQDDAFASFGGNRNRGRGGGGRGRGRGGGCHDDHRDSGRGGGETMFSHLCKCLFSQGSPCFNLVNRPCAWCKLN